MPKSEQFREYAKDALNWALRSKTEKEREALIYLAQTWTLAAQREALSRIDYVLGNLAPDNPILGRVPHLELASHNFGGGDNFKIGDWYEVPDFQLALAHNGQSRRLHATNPDDSPRALPKNDGRGARK